MLTEMTAIETAARVCARDLSAREVTDAALARIEATEPQANAFIHVDPEGARAAADALDGRIAAGEDPGPLAGVPVSVKDLVHVEGMPTSFGSRAFAGTPAPGDAVAVARLRAAGAVMVGKTTTPEFGHKPVTAGQLFGETLNPWNRAYTSGGSSGGAAVSVAIKQVSLAIGTDGGGSVRIPASICGVWGLKATLGRIPHNHAPDLFANNSYLGPIARTLEDLRLMLSVMAGETPLDPWSKALPVETGLLKGAPRIAVALKVGNPVVEPDVEVAFNAALAALSDIGAEIRPVELDLAAAEPHFLATLETLLAARTGARTRQSPELFDVTLARTIENGLARSAVEVQTAAAARSELYRAIERLLDEHDYLVTPTLSAASLPADTDVHAHVNISGQDCGRIRAGWYPYTFPFNLTGHPALSMPCGRDRKNLPIGLQIVGRWYDETGMLDLASRLLPRLAWAGTRPAEPL